MTGDLPTPIKYFNREIHGAYKQLEERAERKLLAMLPEELQNAFRPCVMPDAQSYEYRLVKAAGQALRLYQVRGGVEGGATTSSGRRRRA